MNRWIGSSARMILLLLTVLAFGCRGVISSPIVSKSDEGIPPLAQLVANPGPYKGRLLILGGEILRLTKVGGNTWIDFAEIPLYEDFHPVRGAFPGGRFRVVATAELDDLLYDEGKVVTVAAEFMGTVQDDPTLPLFYSREMYVWNKLRKDRFLPFGAGLK